MDLQLLWQVGQAIAGAVAVAFVLLTPAIYRARNAARDTTATAQAETVGMLQAQNASLRSENADLRTDLTACESENRGLRRKVSQDAP